MIKGRSFNICSFSYFFQIAPSEAEGGYEKYRLGINTMPSPYQGFDQFIIYDSD